MVGGGERWRTGGVTHHKAEEDGVGEHPDHKDDVEDCQGKGFALADHVGACMPLAASVRSPRQSLHLPHCHIQ